MPLPENGNLRLSEHRVKTDTFTVFIDTDKTPEEVIHYYERETARNGWKKIRTTDFGPLISVEAVKDAYCLQVQVSREGEITQVHLTRTPLGTP